MKRLFLFDYDGPCVLPGSVTYDSLKEVGNNLLRVSRKAPLSDESWAQIFAKTSGTTELNTLRVLAEQTGFTTIDGKPQPYFVRDFLYLRRQYIIDTSVLKDELGPNEIDQLYPDLPFFIKHATTQDDLVWLVTGNPRETMRERLRFFPELKEIFSRSGELLGAFGDEAYTRAELIQLAIERAKELGFAPTYDGQDWAENIYYIGDASMDLHAALETKVRHILIPRDPKHEYKIEEANPPGRTSVHGRISRYPNPIMRRGITTFEENGPRVLYTGSLYNPNLIRFTHPELAGNKEELEALSKEYEDKILAYELEDYENLEQGEFSKFL